MVEKDKNVEYNNYTWKNKLSGRNVKMTISFSGLASGLDTDSWVSALVSVKQLSVTSLQNQLSEIEQTQSTLSSLKSSFTALQTALQALTDSLYSASMDIFASNVATSSDESVFTATVTTDATRDTYDITVKQLATNTTAQAADAVSEVADGNTKLSDLGIQTGSFSVYVDGVRTEINIEENYTVANLQSLLSQAGVTLSIDEETGILSLAATDSSAELGIGANTDTSNFVSLLGLEINDEGVYESSSSVYKVNGSVLLTDESAGFTTQITAGTFTIGNATFTIDETTTLDSLIAEINSNADANVYASWDSANGKLVLRSTVEGASYINIEAGTSNFTDVMGLTSTEYDDDGEVVSTRLITSAQTLGQNAIVNINGTDIVSTSNTITSDVSKLTGVTLTLKSVNTDETGSTTLTIEQDTSGIVEALTEVIDAYNTLMSEIDTDTAIGADLHGETTLNAIYSSMRNIMNSSTDIDNIYTLLSQIGISTGDASSTLASDTVSLSLDEDTLAEALATNSDAVKALLVGTNGILSSLKTVVDNALYTGGYFSTKESSLSNQISNMESKIEKRQASVDSYQARLEAKFAAMELVISQLNANYSSLLG